MPSETNYPTIDGKGFNIVQPSTPIIAKRPTNYDTIDEEFLLEYIRKHGVVGEIPPSFYRHLFNAAREHFTKTRKE